MIGVQPLKEQVEASVSSVSVHIGEGGAHRHSSQSPLSPLAPDGRCMPFRTLFLFVDPSAAALSEILCLQRMRGNGVKGHSIQKRELSPRRLGKMASPKGVSGGETSRPLPIFSWAWRLPQQALNEPNYTWHHSPPDVYQQPPCSFSSQTPGLGPEKGA